MSLLYAPLPSRSRSRSRSSSKHSHHCRHRSGSHSRHPSREKNSSVDNAKRASASWNEFFSDAMREQGAHSNTSPAVVNSLQSLCLDSAKPWPPLDKKTDCTSLSAADKHALLPWPPLGQANPALKCGALRPEVRVVWADVPRKESLVDAIGCKPNKERRRGKPAIDNVA